MSPIPRVAFALPGLHRVDRGAEVAFRNIACRLRHLDLDVHLIGSGSPEATDHGYAFTRARSISRETFRTWPSLPGFRTPYAWEDATFAPGLWQAVRRLSPDITVTCNYPWSNWTLRAAGGNRSRHVFVTQNGDWPVTADRAEYRFFGCDGLVCTNPVYFDAHRDRFHAALIPNGVDVDRFAPGDGDPERYNLRPDQPVVLTVAALIPSKRVMSAIEAVALLPRIQLLLCGEGPDHSAVDELGRRLLGDRFRRVVLKPSDMPEAYRAADAVLHVSQDEPFGNVYVEAMASGVPVIAHDWASTRWMLEGYGTLVDSNDLDIVAAAIDTTLSEGPTETRRAGPRIAADRFGWLSIASAYRDFIASVFEAGEDR